MNMPTYFSWDAMHPLVIHFPIVLLLLVPLFIVIAAAVRPGNNYPYMIAALLELALGTASLYVAASTGKQAAELADRSEAVNSVMLAHQHLASRTQVVFTILLLLFVAIVFLPRMKPLPQTRLLTTVIPAAYLCIYAVGVVYLVNTAHDGGRLVHEFGVHAILPQSDVAVPSVPPPSPTLAMTGK